MFDNDENFKTYYPHVNIEQFVEHAGYFFDERRKEYILFHHASPHNEAGNDGEYWTAVHIISRGSIIQQAISSIDRKTVISLGTLFVVISIIISYIFSSVISRPIKMLIDDIDRVINGRLFTPILVRGSNEISYIATAFNRMITAVKKSRAEVEWKVEKQTKQIKASKRALERKQTALVDALENVRREKEVSEERARELQKFRLAVEEASDHIAIIGTDTDIIYANKAFLDFTGFTKEEVLGKKIQDIWCVKISLETIKKIREKIYTNKKVGSWEFLASRKDGSAYPAEVHITPILDTERNILFVLSIWRDLTEEKEIDHIKNEFVSIASHELRTPMTVVREYASLLLDGIPGTVNDQQKQYLQRIKDNIARLIVMVNDMLDINKLEARRMDFAMTDIQIGDIVHAVVADFVELCAKKNIYLSTDIDLVAHKSVYADREKIARVFGNLLSNAYKFTMANGSIVVGARVHAADEHFMEFFIKDTGIGIPLKSQRIIFEKFSQSDKVLQRDIEGTGLGLSISKAIVQKHGGKIWVESIPQKGSTFFFTVPRSKLR